MPATFTIATATDAPTHIRVSIGMVDHRGDKRSVSFRIPATATNAEIDNAAVALANATNSAVYQITKSEVWGTIADASVAVDAVYTSVHDNIALNLKDVATGVQQTAFIPAPEGSLVLDGELVNTVPLLYTAWRSAMEAVTGLDAVSVRFTERRDKNDSVPA